MKRVMPVILALVLIVLMPMTVFAASDEAVNAANELHTLGLFAGVGTNEDGTPIYDLDRTPTRNEAITMLVRLLGKEDEARNGSWTTPFTDVPDWAKPYVGYAYTNGLTAGTSQTTFGGASTITATQYLSFILSALGYQTGEDFQWDQAWRLTDYLGITDGEYVNSASFTRGDITIVSQSALEAKDKVNGKALVYNLLWSDGITTKQLDNTHDGSLMLAADMPDLINNGVTVYNLDDLYDLIILSYRNGQSFVAVNVPGYKSEQLLEVYNKVRLDPIFDNVIYRADTVTCWDNYICPNFVLDDVTLLENYYSNPERYQKNYVMYREDLWYGQEQFDRDLYDLHAWVTKVDSIIRSTITDDMTEKEKAKALHDYICKTSTYDASYENNALMTPHFASNLIFRGHGVCDGYASAYKILLNAAGIECNIIWGYGSTIGHAWNQAKIDGQWYNIDTCWDDTAYNGLPCYEFFGKSSAAFATDGHQQYNLVKETHYCPENLTM